MKQNIFYQDFLFCNIEIDDNDVPAVALKYINNVEYEIDILEEYNLFDYAYGKIRTVSFTKLMSITSEEEWAGVIAASESCDEVIIVDDCTICNPEVDAAKEFYIKTYFYIIGQHCNNCKVLKQ